MSVPVDLLLIHPPYHRRVGSGSVYPLGLGYLASSAEAAGYRVAIIDCAREFPSLRPAHLSVLSSWLGLQLDAMKPRLAIGVGPCTTSAVRGILAVATICRKVLPQIPLIYGGPLASLPNQSDVFFSEFGASAVVPGDGERAVLDMLKALSDGRKLSDLPNVTTPNRIAAPNVIADLDLVPFPRRACATNGTGYYLSTRRDLFAGKHATMTTSRGCPHRCRFCVSGILRGGQYNRRSLGNVIAEIRELQSVNGVRTIVFYDDTFFPSPDSLHEDLAAFSNAITALSLPLTWQAEMRPDALAIIDRSLASQLYAAGCRQLNIGIERTDSLNLHVLGKKADLSKIAVAVAQIHAGAPSLRLAGTFIVGGPNETNQSVLRSVEVVNDIGLLFAHFYPLEVYPETAVYKECFPSDGPLDWFRRIMSDELPWGEILYETPAMGRNDLLAAVADAYKLFYERAKWRRQAAEILGENYPLVAGVVKSWCSDRFSIQEETI